MSSYLGNKKIISLLPNILGLIPVHSTYCELFAGSAQVLLSKRKADHSIIVDKNEKILKQVKSLYSGSLEVVNGCSSVWLDLATSAAIKDLFIYADPPYRLSERSCASTRYRFEMNDQDHAIFLLSVLKSGHKILISHYDSPFYDDFLINWNKKVVNVSYHGKIRKEALYFNYDSNGEMFMPTMAGADKTDRQRIKRKAERWGLNFEKLPVYEQQCILNRLNSVYLAGQSFMSIGDE